MMMEVKTKYIKGNATYYYLSIFTFVCSILLITLSGCEPFQPFQQSRHHFSIMGYLDATADTQWVRVAPIREGVDTPTVLPDMVVTLEDLQSGEAVVMQDSLFRKPGGFYYLNFWTDMEIKPGQTYRLMAERPDGKSSRATVTIPEDFPTPVLMTGGGGPSGHLMMKDMDRIADVRTIWRLPGIPDSTVPYRSVPYREFVRSWTSDDYDFTVSISIGRDAWYLYRRIGLYPPIGASLLDIPRQIFVAAGGPEWNDEIPPLSDLEYNAFPERFSNVENGIGYLIGIVSKTIPVKECSDEMGEIIGCPEEKPFFW